MHLIFGSMYDPAFTLGWNFVYFHGAAEEVVSGKIAAGPPDLVGGNVPRDSVADGVHACLVYEQPAKLFVWNSGTAEAIVSEDTPGAHAQALLPGRADSVLWLKTVVARHGLICLDTDTEALAYAQRVFAAKQSHI